VATFQTAPGVLPSLLFRLEDARLRTDDLFRLLQPNSIYERPIAERHRLIFYLGHLEAFDWNLLSPKLDLEPYEPEMAKLFAFGIDPVDGGLPSDVPADWPTVVQVEDYNRELRRRLDQALNGLSGSRFVPEIADGTLLNVAIEHRLMHAETIAYLLHGLPLENKIVPLHALQPDSASAPQPRQVKVPAGDATLGQERHVENFGWDNEFNSERVAVPSFSIDVFPVRNQEYLKFVQAGGYENASYWRPVDWEWKQQQGLAHPHFWTRTLTSPSTDAETQWEFRGMFGTIPLPESWPVYVSYAEAAAFANWAGKKLPSEAQWQRAAYGTPEGEERVYPWGFAPPDATRGNFHHAQWDPSAVDAHPDGASAFGIFDLLGNGWEWTSTPFAPLPGFEPFPFYRGYSANFFDGKHFVMKGGSARTDACMLRRSFRNWFQPHYPYVYAKFRCVEE
jgi:gamma-glutamyl hercynylcysteine S-oxide synthase